MEHEHAATAHMRPPEKLDYSLTGENARRAVEMGLAEADWYQTPVSRSELRKLLERKNGPAIRDTFIWFALLFLTGGLTVYLWGSLWATFPYLIYAVLYATASDSRWHECSHGTAFRSDWMNNLLYEISSFMVMRESVVWRWSHTRHHSDTIIIGRDPEIQIPRPPDVKALILSCFNLGGYKAYFSSLIRHTLGRISADEKTFIPESEYPKVFRNARIVLGIYLLVVGVSVVFASWVPIFLFVLPQFFGTWLMILHNTTQHAGLAENVLDHRLNCRTVFMPLPNRFIYWNMNYHLEHHMFPLVPYHALPKLHELIKHDCPPPYSGIFTAWREIFPAILKQIKNPSYHVKRKLPAPAPVKEEGLYKAEAEPSEEGWLEVCAARDLVNEDVIRFDYKRKTFALCRDGKGRLYASDGICTHGNTHLAGGLVKGGIIECPKHNGRFNLEDGSPARAPVCRGLATYPIKDVGGRIWLNVMHPGGAGARQEKIYRLSVVSNRSVSTFIKEIVLKPLDTLPDIKPGDYLQFDIPSYKRISFSDFDIPEPYAEVWRRQQVFDLEVSNEEEGRRNNYSLANNPVAEGVLKFNVRIATPPPGQDCPPGVGSSYMFNLREGDHVSVVGPFGDFHIKPTQKEMVYIGGGAGMAPLRAHISHLFENENTNRKISFWYGARSKQEIFYADYFGDLSRQHENFDFEIALSEPLELDEWEGHKGFIHDIVYENLLVSHPNPKAIEFYLCGPPLMIKACTKMLKKVGVDESQVSYDEF
ncbi:MAG: NADH:ubiquinone reductase (Na(+)-transporting) subunit F [Opitutales bacterium]|nr:NADH:ubiquinone reductase (Na(+)-transporting) subunit F [Opitutales bacterium]